MRVDRLRCKAKSHDLCAHTVRSDLCVHTVRSDRPDGPWTQKVTPWLPNIPCRWPPVANKFYQVSLEDDTAFFNEITVFVSSITLIALFSIDMS